MRYKIMFAENVRRYTTYVVDVDDPEQQALLGKAEGEFTYCPEELGVDEIDAFRDIVESTPDSGEDYEPAGDPETGVMVEALSPQINHG